MQMPDRKKNSQPGNFLHTQSDKFFFIFISITYLEKKVPLKAITIQKLNFIPIIVSEWLLDLK